MVPDELAEARGIQRERGIYLGESEVLRRSWLSERIGEEDKTVGMAIIERKPLGTQKKIVQKERRSAL